jgi:hypothetical protein
MSALNIAPEYAPWQWVALNQPYSHFGMFNGIATGKTYTGAHFALEHIMDYPDLTGFIGANTYDQMNQATLRELFYWFEEYGIQYVIDRVPPAHWGAKKFKKYHNILTVYFRGKPTTIFTRVLSDGNPLRGMEFSWYWIDETRDTPEETHDIILSRLRESSYVKGLVTTTTAGEDWAYDRFVKREKIKKGQEHMFMSMHVPTIKSVEAGIISQDFYNTLEASYSEMMALQELWAKHVNVGGGRAYYAAGEQNKLLTAPWGDHYPSKERPLIVGCDFNYSPAPCVWMVGQLGPNIIDPKTGMYFSEMIHWFGEVSGVEMSTKQMATDLVSNYPNFFYEIYGDASGERGSTSNAGETDYNQIAEVLEEAGQVFTIDTDQANPRVKDRVENMNYMFKSLRGDVRQTYDPNRCPFFDKDTRMAGWKQNSGANGKLDSGGDVEVTHASDGAGYAVWKKFPPIKRAYLTEANMSPRMQEIDSVLAGRPRDNELLG